MSPSHSFDKGQKSKVRYFDFEGWSFGLKYHIKISIQLKQ